MTLTERFLEYVKIPTSSDADSTTVPTAKKEFDLARRLVEDMKEIGIADAYIDEMCYVYGHIPATPGYENKTKIGFIAHVDTSPDFADSPIKPCIIENYNGEDVILSDSGRVLTTKNFPHLTGLKGRTLITTDGHTLLGADDKAGVAEILYAMEQIIKSGVPHGPISIGFTPDEECGVSADNFNLEAFDAELAYTVDGGEEGEVVYENFNACSAAFEVNGFNIHPGSAKDTMINASLVAMEINSMLPTGETPRDTEGYEGFFHLCDMEGNVEKANLYYIVRDHRAANYAARQDTLRHIEKLINAKYGEGTAKLTINESYRNMEERIRPVFHVVEIAEEATRMAGVTVSNTPIRGGTDGARLSFMGLPTPNLGTGGCAFHGPYEHITVEGMEKAAEIIVNIVKLYGEN
ncbi:MAG: peptidase T [Ruminococcaceae bacterium]|nr:peptidase T [Oscillospiraceae bacterium]